MITSRCNRHTPQHQCKRTQLHQWPPTGKAEYVVVVTISSLVYAAGMSQVFGWSWSWNLIRIFLWRVYLIIISIKKQITTPHLVIYYEFHSKIQYFDLGVRPFDFLHAIRHSVVVNLMHYTCISFLLKVTFDSFSFYVIWGQFSCAVLVPWFLTICHVISKNLIDFCILLFII